MYKIIVRALEEEKIILKKRYLYESSRHTTIFNYALYIALFYGILMVATISVIGIKSTRYASSSLYQMRFTNETKTAINKTDSLPLLNSGQRMIDYQFVDKKKIIGLSEEDYQNLLKIVEAEAGCEDEEGKLFVANVVINRVQNPAFPNSVTGVIYQREQGVTQFSPISNGRFNQVQVSEETCEAVERALMGENNAQGALYFVARDYAETDKMACFDEHLTFLFAYGGHEFFK